MTITDPDVADAQMTNARMIDHQTATDTQTTLPAPSLARMQQAAGRASQLLKALSHPDRLLLLCQLSQGEYCVSELEQSVGIGQPSLSQQLGVLRQDGLVYARRAGKHMYYSIASDDALAVLQVLYLRFCPTETPV